MIKTFLVISLLFCASLLFAANATPTAISTVSVAGSTVTVNATAHGLIANQGFCIAGSSVANLCGVVAAATANAFTFSMSGQTACASSCGTVAPAPRVIVLSQTVPDQGHFVVSYLLWLTTQQPCPAGASAWKAANGSAGASAAQSNAVAAGSFVEKGKSVIFPANAATTDMTTFLQNDYTMEQQALAQSVQPCQYYGQVYDGAGWAKQ